MELRAGWEDISKNSVNQKAMRIACLKFDDEG